MEPIEKKVLLKEGMTYKFCTCGASQTMPYCDGSHKQINEEETSHYASLKITPAEDIDVTVSSNNWKQEEI